MRFYRAQGATGSRQYYSPTNYGNYTGTWAFNSAYFGIEVVVTGPVGTGTIDGSLVGTFAQSTVAVVTMRAATAGSITAATCQIVADQSLTMPYVGPKDLPTVGSSAGNTPFRITLTNCPAGMNQITYQLDAPAGVIAAANGTFLAGSGSSAKGVGFALRDSSNNPVGLGTPNTVTAYNAATGGTYPIQLAVQYYRTDTLGPGIVKGALTYTINDAERDRATPGVRVNPASQTNAPLESRTLWLRSLARLRVWSVIPDALYFRYRRKTAAGSRSGVSTVA
jgi:major type 1 subunit fimbrin (pilin)